MAHRATNGDWFPTVCAECCVLLGWTRQRERRKFYCIPCFDTVAHLDDKDT